VVSLRVSVKSGVPGSGIPKPNDVRNVKWYQYVSVKSGDPGGEIPWATELSVKWYDYVCQ
jgi:hypothetical protein